MISKYFYEVLRHLESRHFITGRELRIRMNRGKWFWQRWSVSSFRLLLLKMVDQGLVEERVAPTNFSDEDDVILPLLTRSIARERIVQLLPLNRSMYRRRV